MRREYGLPTMRFLRLHNAIEIDDKRYAQRGDPAKGSRHILSVTRLDESYKGVGQVVCAVAILRRRMADITYTIVGGGALMGEIVALTKALGVHDIVNVRGPLSDNDLAAAYQSANVFVLPSRKEGFGIVFLEAWKHGLPVICGNADASPEVVTHGVNGLVVDPDDIVGLAGAIESLLTDPTRAREMADRGREAIVTKFSAGIFHDAVRDILADTIAPRSNAAAQ